MEKRWDMLVHGVYIVTAAYEGLRGGLTLAYATQLSADVVLIAVGQQSWTRDLIDGSKAFGLTQLAADQVSLAELFGTHSGRDIDKLEWACWHTAKTGSPLLDDGVLALDCRVEATIDEPLTKAELLIGRVVHAERLRGSAEPLIYKTSDYA